jgi:hypothetical protein
LDFVVPPTPCEECEGTGYRTAWMHDGEVDGVVYLDEMDVACSACRGTGHRHLEDPVRG